MSARVLVTAGAALLIAGCARFERGRGFDAVRGQVQERAGMKVVWDSDSPEDADARAAVDSLLAEDLTVDGAVQVALLNNRGLRAVFEDLSIAQADVVRAGALRNPVLGLDVRFAEAGAGTALDLSLMQDVVALLMMPRRQALASAGFEAATLRVTGAVLDLAGEVRATFYALQAAEQTAGARRTAADAMGASYEMAKRLRAAGNIRELDLYRERAVSEEAKIDLARAEARALHLREQMNELMGLWGARTGWRLAGRLPAVADDEMALDGLERRAIENSLDLGAARREIEVAARTLGIVRPLGGIDEIEAGVVAEREVEGEWSVGPGFSLPIPLFDQGQGAIGEADARLRQASERYAALAVRVRARVRGAHSALMAARDRAVYYERVILPLRGAILEQAQLQYNAMQVSPFELLQAKRDQVEAGAAMIAALGDYWAARSRLDLLLAGRVPATSHEMSEEPTRSTARSSGQGGH